MGYFLYFFVLFILISLYITSVSFAPWVPVRTKDLKRIKEFANLKDGEVFYDLGCGDGKIVFYMNEHTNGVARGVELAIPFFVFCKIKQFVKSFSLSEEKKKNIQFKFKNFYQENLSEADVVFIFAASSDYIKKKLRDKFKKELKKGSRVISYSFPVPEWEEVLVDKPNKENLKIYVYKI